MLKKLGFPSTMLLRIRFDSLCSNFQGFPLVLKSDGFINCSGGEGIPSRPRFFGYLFFGEGARRSLLFSILRGAGNFGSFGKEG
jgi:hypothetical protein